MKATCDDLAEEALRRELFVASALLCRFSEKANAISVILTPHGDIKKAASALKPVNVTCAPSRINCIMQENPPRATCDTIGATGTREHYVATSEIWVHAGVEDEGIWLESDAGTKVLAGTAELPTARRRITAV